MRIEAINGMLHQWDTGRQVQVTCDEGMTLEEVRFSHHRSPSVIRVTPDANGAADIPDELLRDAGQLTVSAVMVDARGKQHVRSECFCTDDAVRPADYNAGGGSGGGSGGGGGDIIVITANDDGSMTCNMTFEEVVTLRDKYPRAVLNGVSYGNQYGFCDCCIDIYWPSGTENSVYFAFLKLPMFARLKYYPDGRLEMAEYIDNIFAQGQG